MNENLSTFWRKLFGRDVETAFDVCIGSFWEVWCEKKNQIHLSSLHTELNIFGIQSKIFHEICQKNPLIFKSFPDIKSKLFALLSGKVPTRLPKLNSICLQEQIERKTSLEKTSNVAFTFFGHWPEKFWLFIDFFPDQVVKSVFYVWIGTLRGKIFSKSYLSFQFYFGIWPDKNSGFRQIFFGRLEKVAFFVSIDLFWGDSFQKKNTSLSFLDNEQNIFGCKNGILRVPRNILTRVFYEEKVYFVISFVFWANFFSFLWQYFKQDCRNWSLPVDRKLLK